MPAMSVHVDTETKKVILVIADEDYGDQKLELWPEAAMTLAGELATGARILG